MSLRDAAQQALGALYIAQDDCIHGEMAEPSPIFEKAITALEAALAEPKSDTSSDYERGFIDGMQKQMQSSVDKAVNRMAALAEPQPEPVAWVSKHALDRIKDFDGTIYANGGFDDAAPLYTAPPQRQPLTIDECECAYHDLPNRPDWPNMATLWELLTAFVEGVRYAEKAHGIGGDK